MVQSLPGFLNLSLNVCSPCQVLGDVYTEVLEATHPLHRGPTDHKRSVGPLLSLPTVHDQLRMGVGRSFHQPGTVNENVLESDFVPFCDGTTRRHSLTDFKGCGLSPVSGGRRVLSLWLYASIKRCNQPVQRDKERCDMGPIGFAEDQSCISILNNLYRFDCA